MNARYFRYCPRGFTNEIVVFRVPEGKRHEVEVFLESRMGDTEDRSEWLPADYKPRKWEAVDWADREHFGLHTS